VPLAAGRFDLDSYIDYVIGMLRFLGPGTSVMAVCQPSVPVLAAVSLLNEAKDVHAPSAMILMGGPIDTRRNPTAVNRLAEQRGIDWFRRNVTMKVPPPHAGVMRDVYPGFLQLGGFMTMNLDRHIDAHRELSGTRRWRWRLCREAPRILRRIHVGDGLDREFYLQTVEKVFVNHDLPRGTFTHRGVKVDPSKITATALMTVEGERDDISGVGQTEAAHQLCTSLPAAKKLHYLQNGCRPLWRFQRLALPQGSGATHRFLHQRQRLMASALRHLRRMLAPKPLEPARLTFGDQELDVVFRRHFRRETSGPSPQSGRNRGTGDGAPWRFPFATHSTS